MSNGIKCVPLKLMLPESESDEQNNNCPDTDNKEQLHRCEQKVTYIINQLIEEAVQQSKKRKRCEMDCNEEPLINKIL